MSEMKTFNGKEIVDAKAREDISRLSSEMENKVGTSELNTAVDNALTQAKESGAFNGADGQDGADGKDGSDGNDGYTPIKGVDYFDGEDGEDGYTPVKGTDYWTEADKEEIVTEAKAELSQLEPLFAESVEWLEASGDKSKVYVLPDGYIYAYMLSDGTSEQTETMNLEWSVGVKLDKTTGAESTASGYCASDSFTVSADDVYSLSMASNYYVGMGVCYYDANGACVGYVSTWSQGTSDSSSSQSVTLDVPDTAISARLRASVVYSDNDNALELLEGVILAHSYTVESNTYMWANTGHAFVPADYEERILNLESDTTDLDVRLKVVEGLDLNGVPSYVREEAERVSNLLLDIIDENSLVIASCSDMHHYYDTSKEGNIQAVQHTAMGISEISKFVPIDLFINHGDYVPETGIVKDTMKYIRYCLSMVYGIDDMEEMWLMGNHDLYDSNVTKQQMVSLVGKRNQFNVTDNEGKTRTYGYKDFAESKIRVIYLNTTDHLGTSNFSYYMVSPEQCAWLIKEALNFSDKEDATEWGIVIASHIPIDWGYHVGKLINIVDAYIDGATGTIDVDESSLTYDFSNVSKAEVIGCLHGHTHNFIARTIGTHSIPSLSTPQVCFERYNNYYESEPEYGEFDEEGNAVFHYKTTDTTESTSFVMYVIDRTKKKIHAIHYGAGTDREIDY